MYAALIEGLPPDERARLDGELALPMGKTGESVDAERREWMQLHGWQI